MRYKLDRGKNYTFVLADSAKVCSGGDARIVRLGLSARYVTRQTLPFTGGDWETFFTYFGGTRIPGSEGIVCMDGILMRVRVPADGITRIEGDRIFVDGELVTKLIFDDNHDRTPLVKKWLDKVRAIEKL